MGFSELEDDLRSTESLRKVMLDYAKRLNDDVKQEWIDLLKQRFGDDYDREYHPQPLAEEHQEKPQLPRTPEYITEGEISSKNLKLSLGNTVEQGVCQKQKVSMKVSTTGNQPMEFGEDDSGLLKQKDGFELVDAEIQNSDKLSYTLMERKHLGVRHTSVKRRYHRTRKKKTTSRPDYVIDLKRYGMFGGSILRDRLVNRKAQRDSKDINRFSKSTGAKIVVTVIIAEPGSASSMENEDPNTVYGDGFMQLVIPFDSPEISKFQFVSEATEKLEIGKTLKDESDNSLAGSMLCDPNSSLIHTGFTRADRTNDTMEFINAEDVDSKMLLPVKQPLEESQMTWFKAWWDPIDGTGAFELYMRATQVGHNRNKYTLPQSVAMVNGIYLRVGAKEKQTINLSPICCAWDPGGTWLEKANWDKLLEWLDLQFYERKNLNESDRLLDYSLRLCLCNVTDLDDWSKLDHWHVLSSSDIALELVDKKVSDDEASGSVIWRSVNWITSFDGTGKEEQIKEQTIVSDNKRTNRNLMLLRQCEPGESTCIMRHLILIRGLSVITEECLLLYKESDTLSQLNLAIVGHVPSEEQLQGKGFSAYAWAWDESCRRKNGGLAEVNIDLFSPDGDCVGALGITDDLQNLLHEAISGRAVQLRLLCDRAAAWYAQNRELIARSELVPRRFKTGKKCDSTKAENSVSGPHWACHGQNSTSAGTRLGIILQAQQRKLFKDHKPLDISKTVMEVKPRSGVEGFYMEDVCYYKWPLPWANKFGLFCVKMWIWGLVKISLGKQLFVFSWANRIWEPGRVSIKPVQWELLDCSVDPDSIVILIST